MSSSNFSKFTFFISDLLFDRKYATVGCRVQFKPGSGETATSIDLARIDGKIKCLDKINGTGVISPVSSSRLAEYSEFGFPLSSVELLDSDINHDVLVDRMVSFHPRPSSIQHKYYFIQPESTALERVVACKQAGNNNKELEVSMAIKRGSYQPQLWRVDNSKHLVNDQWFRGVDGHRVLRSFVLCVTNDNPGPDHEHTLIARPADKGTESTADPVPRGRTAAAAADRRANGRRHA